jgi:N6-adenosine-specific RNA methylase IME4
MNPENEYALAETGQRSPALAPAPGWPHFRCVMADPPWSYRASQPTERLRPCVERGEHPAGIGHYYETMRTAQIAALPVAEWCEPDAVLFLWATVPLLPDAMRVMEAWGFRYKTMLTWHKTDRDGMGYWFRVFTEHLLVGVRGNVKAFGSMRRNVVECRRGRHSEKPEQVREIVEEVCAGPRLEMFARVQRPGWHCMGNEVECDLLSANT